ncbi:hypothetical protein BJ138DRAFT_1117852 [Hygrophoropsis aurantiaca]|uniref:Uncharacterized protein n=1 Tax=Hygrophoropsis aurantiaca TaxID=72124 RepID=A0ACB8A0K5_9AGAM|nr:hypothetical protein BJ138DRAFT_1117852 [Hygrophoropsis aurantiaca]
MADRRYKFQDIQLVNECLVLSGLVGREGCQRGSLSRDPMPLSSVASSRAPTPKSLSPSLFPLFNLKLKHTGLHISYVLNPHSSQPAPELIPQNPNTMTNTIMTPPICQGYLLDEETLPARVARDDAPSDSDSESEDTDSDSEDRATSNNRSIHALYKSLVEKANLDSRKVALVHVKSDRRTTPDQRTTPDTTPPATGFVIALAANFKIKRHVQLPNALPPAEVYAELQAVLGETGEPGIFLAYDA